MLGSGLFNNKNKTLPGVYVNFRMNKAYTPSSSNGGSYDDGSSSSTNKDILLQTKTITQNGTYTPDSIYDGFSKVIVNVKEDLSEIVALLGGI